MVSQNEGQSLAIYFLFIKWKVCQPAFTCSNSIVQILKKERGIFSKLKIKIHKEVN